MQLPASNGQGPPHQQLGVGPAPANSWSVVPVGVGSHCWQLLPVASIPLHLHVNMTAVACETKTKLGPPTRLDGSLQSSALQSAMQNSTAMSHPQPPESITQEAMPLPVGLCAGALQADR